MSRKRKSLMHKIRCNSIVSLFLVMAMLIAMLPANGTIAYAADDQVQVKIHFAKPDDWTEVYAYAGGPGTTWEAISGYEQYASWPGAPLAKDGDGYYVLEIVKSVSSELNFIFNNNNGAQTKDLQISADILAQYAGGELNVWTDISGTLSYSKPDESNNVIVKINAKNSAEWANVFAYVWPVMEGDGAYNSWPGVQLSTENKMNEGYYSFAVKADKTKDFNFILNNSSGIQTADITIPADILAADADGIVEVWKETNDLSNGYTTVAPENWKVKIRLHLINTANWSNIHVYSGEGNWEEMNTADWPGNLVPEDKYGCYSYEIEKSSESKLMYIFNNGNGGSGNQTADLAIEVDVMQADIDGIVDVWVDHEGNMQYTLPESVLVSPTIKDGKVTFSYYGPEATTVSVRGNMNGWDETPMEKDEFGVWSCSMAVPEGDCQYKFYVDEQWITDPKNVATYDGNSYVYVYYSPVVNGNSVTFKYYNTIASSVEVRGSMDNWSAGYPMTKNEKGVWSCTVENIEPGKIEYKFIVDNNWITDPMNSSLSDGGNSVVVLNGLFGDTLSGKRGTIVSLPATLKYTSEDGVTSDVPVTYTTDDDDVILGATTVEIPADYTKEEVLLTATTEDGNTAIVRVQIYENNQVIVKLHYNRPDGNYDKWNVWFWTDNQGGEAYDFEVEDGEHVATFVVGNSLYTNSVNFIVRKGEWDSQEGGDRGVSISEIVSGTVHCYVEAGKTSQGDVRIDVSEAIFGTKLNKVSYDREKNTVVVSSSKVIVDVENAFAIRKLDGTMLTITKVVQDGNACVISIEEDLTALIDVCKTYILTYNGDDYTVTMPNVYSSEEFENEFTYTGNDLGATWHKSATTFRVWAPTAESVSINLYADGTTMEDDVDYVDESNPGNIEDDKPYQVISMTKGDKGVWSATVIDDLEGVYYTYSTNVNGEIQESCDPYARATGVNGERAMVINLDGTDPMGWEKDVRPHKDMNYTDAVIYELHVRDFSIDESSGVSEANRGKFLAFTEEGTTVDGKGQVSTGIDHLVDLGVTHIHLLPIYDYASVDETMTEAEKAKNLEKQFNWGYDPENYNVPEGSYSSNPEDGAVRVKEMKEMVKALHDNNINVIMDVVYNHVYDAGTFGFNEIVPNYFSRTNEDGSFSNGSGCGNDTASERNMVRKYIVDSILYWADEYHIDGFRFDLVGLIDVETINTLVEEVHKVNPDIIFYGEGWTMGTAVSKENIILATQANSEKTPDFAYFSDTIRDLLRGGNFNETDKGYISGVTGKQDEVINNLMASPHWTNNPTQIINYVSCHDNYTLFDKINVSTDASREDSIKMNNLSAALYMSAQGIPLVHAGEELLRTKVDILNDNEVIHNSYKSPDYINSIKWEDLESEEYQEVYEYYKGLIEFRKNHSGLRLTTNAEVQKYVSGKKLANEAVMITISGDSTGEVSDGIVMIFNPANEELSVDLYVNGIEKGEWNVVVNSEKAGNKVIETITDGKVTVAPISAMILVKGELEDTDSVYDKNTNIAVDNIVLDREAVELEISESVMLVATVTPENATHKDVVWSSSDESVATVEQNGKVTAVSEGTTIITVTANGMSATCKVTVKEESVEVIEVCKIKLNKQYAKLMKNDVLTLRATITPANATDKTVVWSSSDESVATVEQNGKVTAVGKGTVTITATSSNGKIATCKITVEEKNETTENESFIIKILKHIIKLIFFRK